MRSTGVVIERVQLLRVYCTCRVLRSSIQMHSVCEFRESPLLIISTSYWHNLGPFGLDA